MAQKTIVIAGGGTGGHIYPAIAIAKAMQKADANVQIHFVGTPAGLETKIVPRENFPLHLINVGKLNYAGGIFGKIKTLLMLPFAFIQSVSLLMEIKPLAVLGVGGYVSGPFVLISSLLGFKSAIWEPNAHPGLTNRWLSRFVTKSFVVFEDAKKELKSREVVQVGLPVRQQVEALAGKKTERNDGQFHILIFGGSQGARALNKIVTEAILKGGEWLKDTQIVHQTGVHDFASAEQAYQSLQNIKAMEYLHDMEKQYEWADLIICRSGASTVAEVAACAKPAIMVPLPWAADDHQRKNAESLVAHRAGIMLEQKDLTAEKLIETVQTLKNNSQLRQEMRQNLQRFYKPQAAENIARLLLSAGES